MALHLVEELTHHHKPVETMLSSRHAVMGCGTTHTLQPACGIAHSSLAKQAAHQMATTRRYNTREGIFSYGLPSALLDLLCSVRLLAYLMCKKRSSFLITIERRGSSVLTSLATLLNASTCLRRKTHVRRTNLAAFYYAHKTLKVRTA